MFSLLPAVVPYRAHGPLVGSCGFYNVICGLRKPALRSASMFVSAAGGGAAHTDGAVYSHVKGLVTDAQQPPHRPTYRYGPTGVEGVFKV